MSLRSTLLFEEARKAFKEPRTAQRQGPAKRIPHMAESRPDYQVQTKQTEQSFVIIT